MGFKGRQWIRIFQPHSNLSNTVHVLVSCGCYTKLLQLVDLKQRNFFFLSHSSGGSKSKTKVLTRSSALCSSRGAFLASLWLLATAKTAGIPWLAAESLQACLSHHTASSLCDFTSFPCVCVSVSMCCFSLPLILD